MESNAWCPRLTAAMILSGCEGLRFGVGLGEEAVDGGLEVDDGAVDAAFHRRPSMPSFMNRSCQRQTQVAHDLVVPTPSALERMIAARQACFCEALRSLGDRFQVGRGRTA